MRFLHTISNYRILFIEVYIEVLFLFFMKRNKYLHWFVASAPVAIAFSFNHKSKR